MNIHPLFVNIPIALLALYAIMELIHTDRLNHSDTYAAVKGFLAIVGTLAAYVTIVAVDIAESPLLANRPELRPLVETHASFALASVVIFSVLALAYVIKFMSGSRYTQAPILTSGPFALIRSFMRWYSAAIREHVLGQMLAMAGIICIIITGGLGLSIMYGPDSDPVVRVIYGMFS